MSNQFEMSHFRIKTSKPNDMKSTKPKHLMNLSKFCFLILILFAYSCNTDQTDLEANAESLKSRLSSDNKAKYSVSVVLPGLNSEMPLCK